MNTYKVTFITLDGNTNQVLVDAANERRATQIFENDYQFESIVSCVQEDEMEYVKTEIFNLVEALADDDECTFDQPCKNGNRVGGHAVYCHSNNPDAPRKCRRTWYTGGKVKDENCPFYIPNPNYVAK